MKRRDVNIGDVVMVLTKGGEYGHGFNKYTIVKVTQLDTVYVGVVGRSKYGDSDVLQCVPYDEIAPASLAYALRVLE